MSPSVVSTDLLVPEMQGSREEPAVSLRERKEPLDVPGIFQMTGMSLGMGIFVIPDVFVGLGWAQGSVWLLILSCLAERAMQGALDLAAARNAVSYEVLMETAFGGLGKFVLVITAVLTAFGATLSYASTARDLLLEVSVAFLLDVDINAAPYDIEVLTKAKAAVALAVLLGAMLPVCLGSGMDDKAWIAGYGVCSLVIASVFFTGRCFQLLAGGCGEGIECGHAPPAVRGSPTEVLELCARLAFSYSMIWGVFPVLKDRALAAAAATAAASANRGATGSATEVATTADLAETLPVAQVVPQMKRVVRYSVLLCFAIYLAIGLVGSVTFGSATKAVALQNLPLVEPLAQLITLMVGLSMLLFVALTSFPTMEGLCVLLGFSNHSAKRERVRRWVVVSVLGAAVLVDTFLPTTVAFALTGSVGISLAAYIFPSLLFFRLSEHSRASVGGVRGFLSLAALLAGLVLMLASTPTILMKLFEAGAEQRQPSHTLRSYTC